MSTLFVRSKWNEQARDEEKWEVLDINTVPQPHGFHGKSEYEWYVRAKHGNVDSRAFHILPKSDYVPCAAPGVWERVEVDLGAEPSQVALPASLTVLPYQCQDFFFQQGDRIGQILFIDPGYRVVSLVVERRKGT